MTDKFDHWCIVELFGHNQIAGKVTEQAIGGQSFVRVDVPKTVTRDPFTKFFGGGAIYAITPVEQSIAEAMAAGLDVVPIQEWRLKTVDVSRQLPEPDPGEFDHPDWPVADAWDAEDDEDEDEKEVADVDKQAAAQWARDLLAAGNFVIVDSETTGFDDHDEIIQIGIIDSTGAVLLDQLIKPEQPILNSQYHGITDDLVQDAPAFPEVYEAIRAALDGKRRLAYNLEYDSRMINQVCYKHNLPKFLFAEDSCIMEQFAAFYGEWNDYRGNYKWQKLREALAHFGLNHTDFGTKEHDACTDAKATLAVIQKMAAWTPEENA